MCHRNTVRKSSHISFFCGGDPFCKVVRKPENTHGELTGLLEWPAGPSIPSLEIPADLSPSFQRPVDLCFQSKITDLILSLQVPCGYINIFFALVFFYFMAGYRNLHTSVFFPVICWSYQWTEISVTLSIGNQLYSRHILLYYSFLWKSLCWCYLATALNLLS